MTSSRHGFGLLGPLEATVDGVTADLGGPKQRAVLARLLIDANQVVSVDRLVEDLWGDDAPTTAVATLQAYVSNLRRILEPDRPARGASTVLISRPPGYVLVADPDSIDAMRFEHLLTEGMSWSTERPAESQALLCSALALWRGPALSDFTYEPFASAEIARLGELRLVALEERVEADLACGRGAELVAELEDLAMRHPLRERLWGLLMRALYRSGRQAEALRTYRRLADHLAEELGIEPSTELQRLEQAMLNQDPSLLSGGTTSVVGSPRPADPPGSSGGDGSPPIEELRLVEELAIVGRDFEMVRFETALAAAAQGRGRLILVEGEPGIGKSRLLEAMQRRAHNSGAEVAVARCMEVGRTPAFWPWIQAVRALLGADLRELLPTHAGSDAAGLAPFFPDVLGKTDSVTETVLPHHSGDPWLRMIRSLCGGGPVTILIDDLYAADPDSLALLAMVGAEIDRLPLVLVGSYRTTDLPVDHPLTETLHHVNRIEQVERLPLRRLTLEESGELVRQVSGEVGGEAVRTIHRRTEGNAFFTVELARMLTTDGALFVGGDVSVSTLDAVIPTGVRDVIRRRVAGLEDDAVRLLRVAAVYGRRWELAVVAPISGIDLPRAIDVVDGIVASGMVLEDDRPGWYRFSHVLIADTVAGSLGALRRAGLHGQLADALESRHGSDPLWWVDIAHHAVEAVPVSGPEPAIVPLRRAARHALDTAAVAQGAQLTQEQLDLVLTMPPSPQRDRAELDALVDLAMVSTWRDGYHSDRLGRASTRMLELVSTIEDPGDAAGIVMHALMGQYSTQVVSGRHHEALETAHRFAEVVESSSSPELELIALVLELVTLHHLGRDAEAVALGPKFEELVALVEPEEDGSVLLPLDQQSALVTFRAFFAEALWAQGDREASDAQLARALLIAERSSHPYTQAFAATMVVIVAGFDRDAAMVSDALRWLEGLVDVTEMGVVAAWLEIAAEWAALAAAGEPADTQRLRTLVSALESEGARVVTTLYWAIIAELDLEAGKIDRALEAVCGAIADGRARGEEFWLSELERIHASVLLAQGRLEAAAEAVDRAERDAIERHQPIILERIRRTAAAVAAARRADAAEVHQPSGTGVG